MENLGMIGQSAQPVSQPEMPPALASLADEILTRTYEMNMIVDDINKRLFGEFKEEKDTNEREPQSTYESLNRVRFNLISINKDLLQIIKRIG